MKAQIKCESPEHTQQGVICRKGNKPMFSSPVYAGLFLMACSCTPPLLGIILLSDLHTALYRLSTNIILFIIGKIAFITDNKIPELPKETCSASGIETPIGIRGYHGCAKCREANNNEVSAHP